MAKKGSVLVVDDEEIMRDVLETLLSAEGYRVDLAKTGEEGLDAYTKRAYDIVLLDVSMPGIGGLRALEEFLKIDGEAVVLMITAYATFDTAIAAWEKGAFGCIRKPFQNEHISATVAPSPTAWPFTRAITGLSHSSMRKMIRFASGRLVASHSSGRSIFCCIAITLPPAENARPAPVSTTTFTSGSSCTSSQMRDIE